MIINSPSLANCTLLNMGAEVDQLVAGGAQWFHVDIMDGNYVPNLCFPIKIIPELKAKYPHVLCDVHLMVTDPIAYIQRLRDAGADYVSFHIDSTHFSRRCLEMIRAGGMRAGAVINPSQPISTLVPLLPYCDYVVLMTVEPGYAGQKFMHDSIGRLQELVQLRDEMQLDFLISIDGGVDYEHAEMCVRLGAEVYITGIYTVFNQPDGIVSACRRFQQSMEKVEKERIAAKP